MNSPAVSKARKTLKLDHLKVTLDVQARKFMIDETGVETEMPMNDWVEIGIFGPAEDAMKPGEPLPANALPG